MSISFSSQQNTGAELEINNPEGGSKFSNEEST
jgi:hypothetical protein